VNAKENYTESKNQLASFFQDYVDNHTLDKCVAYYYFLENLSQEDALLFALPMIEKYVEEFEHEIYIHIGCMLLVDGNDSMLYNLLKAEMGTQNADAKLYYNEILIPSIVDGLQKNVRPGFTFSEDYLNALREKLQ